MATMIQSSPVTWALTVPRDPRESVSFADGCMGRLARACRPSFARRPVAAGRRRALTHHLLPAALLVVAVVGVGFLVLTGGESAEESTAKRFAAAYQRGDTRAMYDELTEDARKRTPLRRFSAAYRSARQTTTVTARANGRAPRARRRLARPGHGDDAALRDGARGPARSR